MRLLFALPLYIILLASCASFNPNAFTGQSDQPLTATQIKEMVKNKDGGVLCMVAPTPWGMIHMTSANLDQAPKASGYIEVDANCTVKMNATAIVPPLKEAPK